MTSDAFTKGSKDTFTYGSPILRLTNQNSFSLILLKLSVSLLSEWGNFLLVSLNRKVILVS